jgi:hypothetical protein
VLRRRLVPPEVFADDDWDLADACGALEAFAGDLEAFAGDLEAFAGDLEAFAGDWTPSFSFFHALFTSSRLAPGCALRNLLANLWYAVKLLVEDLRELST